MTLILVLTLLTGCGQIEEKPVRRIDEGGYLYYMEYEKDYYGKEVMDKLKELRIIDPGCSSFMTHNPEGEPLSCRNYDSPHRISKEDRTFTGLNIVLHLKPEGKYESINIADVYWCDPGNPFLVNAGPEKEGFDFSLLDALPYECVDGLNEKGLYVSIMMLDIREGDQPGKIPAGSCFLLRYMLDDCADVKEAIAKVDTAIVTPEDWQGCHFFITDAEGNYAVIESRNSEVSVIRCDLLTNLYRL